MQLLVAASRLGLGKVSRIDITVGKKRIDRLLLALSWNAERAASSSRGQALPGPNNIALLDESVGLVGFQYQSGREGAPPVAIHVDDGQKSPAGLAAILEIAMTIAMMMMMMMMMITIMVISCAVLRVSTPRRARKL